LIEKRGEMDKVASTNDNPPISMTTPKKSVLQLKPYISGKNTDYLFAQSTRIMKLDSNESSLPPSPRVTAALAEEGLAESRRLLAEKFGEQVMAKLS